MNEQQIRPRTIGEADYARYWSEHIPEAQQVLTNAGHGPADEPYRRPPNARKNWWHCRCGSRHNTPRGVGQHWSVYLSVLINHPSARRSQEATR